MKRLLNRVRAICVEEEGQTIVLVAVSFVALLGFAGLAVDVGQMQVTQRQVQSAADASALAGALELGKCGSTADCSAMTAAAQDALSENGLSNSTLATQCGSTSGDALSVLVNNGPCAMGSASADPNYGNSQYVEAVVNKVQPTIFAKVLGITSIDISARAEAGVGNYPGCFVISAAQPTSKSNQLVISGSVTLDQPSCGIVDDSDANNALQFNGSDTITTDGIAVQGGTKVTGTVAVTPSPVSNIPAQPDPLDWLNSDKPTASTCTYTNLVVSTNQTLPAGTYCGGLTIASGVTVNFDPGTYVIEGTMTINTLASVNGTGTTFYFTTGSVDMTGTAHLDLVAPTTGTYAGVLIYQDPSDTASMTMVGDSTTVVQGAIYAPTGSLSLTGNGNLAAYTILDVASATITGNFSLGSDYSSLAGGSPAKGDTSVLVE